LYAGREFVKFSAVAFDLDGTLYPNFSLYIRLVPFILKNHRLLIALDKARTRLRNSDRDSAGKPESSGTDFYEIQARLMGEILGEDTETAREKTERLIYRGWEPHFKNIDLFPHARETLDAFRKAGIRMGLLSDFPPKNKLENLKIAQYWDEVVCSEESGHLKPDSTPFLELAKRMNMPPELILYVGNSVSYDVEGAGRAGMKTALIRSKWRKPFSAAGGPGGSAANFVFYDYRQLRDYVLD